MTVLMVEVPPSPPPPNLTKGKHREVKGRKNIVPIHFFPRKYCQTEETTIQEEPRGNSISWSLGTGWDWSAVRLKTLPTHSGNHSGHNRIRAPSSATKAKRAPTFRKSENLAPLAVSAASLQREVRGSHQVKAARNTFQPLKAAEAAPFEEGYASPC